MNKNHAKHGSAYSRRLAINQDWSGKPDPALSEAAGGGAHKIFRFF
jgi:hypothetical protein